MVVGYRVTNQVRITLHDMKKLGAILDKVVTLGANQIDSIEFGVEEPEALKDEARKLALKNVTDNAKLYAEAAGVGSAKSSASPRRRAPTSPATRRPRPAWRWRRTSPSKPAPLRSRCASG